MTTDPRPAQRLPATTESQEQIRAMVSCLRERLEAIGEQGDCAYERAMGTKYRELLSHLEARLATPRPSV